MDVELGRRFRHLQTLKSAAEALVTKTLFYTIANLNMQQARKNAKAAKDQSPAVVSK